MCASYAVKHIIYLILQLGKQHGFEYTTKCDVEVIMHLYAQGGADNVARSLDGVFAFCLMDVEKRRILIGRDPYGVRPLFELCWGNGQLAICSEGKVLILRIDESLTIIVSVKYMLL